MAVFSRSSSVSSRRVWAVVGIGIGAAIHGYVPEGMMLRIMDDGAWWSIPAAMAVGVPICPNAAGAIPAQALPGKGAAAGMTRAFMMSVIALSLPQMIILRQVRTRCLIAIFTALVAAGKLATPLIVSCLAVAQGHQVQPFAGDVWTVTATKERGSLENLADNAICGLIVTKDGAVLIDRAGHGKRPRLCMRTSAP